MDLGSEKEWLGQFRLMRSSKVRWLVLEKMLDVRNERSVAWVPVEVCGDRRTLNIYGKL
jgi:hypothetical protein